MSRDMVTRNHFHIHVPFQSEKQDLHCSALPEAYKLALVVLLSHALANHSTDGLTTAVINPIARYQQTGPRHIVPGVTA